MPNVFGFNEEELKLLLVAVRQMRRMLARAEKAGVDVPLGPFAERYEKLYGKIRDMAGPLPEDLYKLL